MRTMSKQRLSIKRKKLFVKKEPNRSSAVEKYNHQNEKFTTGAQQQI